MIERLCIVGVGLIGGSLARALREAGVVGEIVGAGRDAAHLQLGVDLGVLDRYHTDPAQAVRGADCVVVATPLGAIGGILEAIREHVEPNVVITDVGSSKRGVADDARAALGDRIANFVPGHPIAGTEKSGITASFPDLFRGRRVILTPLQENRPETVARVRAMWEAAGSTVTEMGLEHHDLVLAATSHLPHMLAYTLVDTLARMDEQAEIFDYAAGGFRDFTRIASSDPVMWRDVCLSNRTAILDLIGRFQADLTALAEAIEAGHDEVLSTVFMRAKEARDRYAERLDDAGEVSE